MKRKAKPRRNHHRMVLARFDYSSVHLRSIDFQLPRGLLLSSSFSCCRLSVYLSLRSSVPIFLGRLAPRRRCHAATQMSADLGDRAIFRRRDYYRPPRDAVSPSLQLERGTHVRGTRGHSQLECNETFGRVNWLTGVNDLVTRPADGSRCSLFPADKLKRAG